jgi:hypothetical protein
LADRTGILGQLTRGSDRPLPALNSLVTIPIALALAAGGCGRGDAALDFESRPIVYGADNRKEYFEVDDQSIRTRVAQSMAVLIPRRFLQQTPDGFSVTALPGTQSQQLCPEEAFSEQPAAAFCAAVLVDRDLVLTSGHCAAPSTDDSGGGGCAIMGRRRPGGAAASAIVVLGFCLLALARWPGRRRC